MTRRGRPPGPTDQGRATWNSLYTTAIRLFSERGYEATTLRGIAREAGVSPGLLYRYFPSKAAVVLALYDELSTDFAARAQAQPSGGWAERVVWVADLSLETLEPYRAVLAAVLPALLVDREAGLLSRSAWSSRDRVRQCFVLAVAEADDGPADAEVLGGLAYLAHLGLILWWVLDRSEGQEATQKLLELTSSWAPTLGWLPSLPGADGLLRQLASLADRALYEDDP